MRRHFTILGVLATVATIALSGCRPQQPFYFSQKNENPAHYVNTATEIEFPDLESASIDEVTGAKPPLTLDNTKPEQMWDLKLEEAVQMTLANSTVIRSLGGLVFGAQGAQGVPSALLGSPLQAMTTYFPAQTESDARTGVEAALSAFDAQFATSVFWEKNDTPQNIAPSLAFFRPEVFQQDLGTFQAQISKDSATGGQFVIRHNVNYEMNNVPLSAKLFSAAYTSNVEMEARQPLLRGAGVQYNRIAGPGAVPGFYNGVMIARLRTDQSLADFEGAVRNLTGDVERSYWNLYYAYRALDSVVAGRDAALQTWRIVRAKFDLGAKGGSAQEEAQARQQYFLFAATVQQSLSNLYKTENSLRYLMGLTVSDGRLIRPADEPTTAKVDFDWYDAHSESLVRSVELRRQKWVIKQRELELIASKNWLLPEVDATARWRWVGLGPKLVDPENDQVPVAGPSGSTFLVPNNAYGSMTSGDFQEWHLGIEARFPFGFRREMAGVRNAQLNLIRERKVLQEQELELSHQLADAFRELSANYQIAQTNYNRRVAARREETAVRAAYEQGTITVDLLLDAQRRLAEAETQYYRSVVDYSLAIMQLHLRKGSLLEYNGVRLAEGPWPAKAYFDAVRRAKARDAAHYIDYGFTMPRVVSRGPVQQMAGENVAADAVSEPGMVPMQPSNPLQRGYPMQPNYPAPPNVPVPAEGVPVPSDGVLAPGQPGSVMPQPSVVPPPPPIPVPPSPPSPPAGDSSSGISPLPPAPKVPQAGVVQPSTEQSQAGGRVDAGTMLSQLVQAAPTTRRKHDLGAMNLDTLAGKGNQWIPVSPSGGSSSPIRQINYEESVAEPSGKAAEGWKPVSR